MNNKSLYIGLMSGTSADGIDLALVDFSSGKIQLVDSYYQAYDNNTRQKITQLYSPGTNELDRAFSLDIILARQFADAVNTFIAKSQLSPDDIVAIGNHGQTIRHRPMASKDISAPFTLQIGCNQILASLTNIRVIGDFRKKDMVFGGQGAPLVPAFHRVLFPSNNNDVFVVNIGGIANISYLPCQHGETPLGFDTGPGNALLDAWYQQHNDGHYDNNGDWAASGTVDHPLLTKMLNDPYFEMAPPKSTGREYFNLDWLDKKLQNTTIPPCDIQATLVALTSITITRAIENTSTKSHVYICGGGVKNKTLYSNIKQELKHHEVEKSDKIQLDHDAIEAMAFAWFAYAYDKNIFGNIPAVTGASRSLVLGAAFNP